MSTFSNPPEVEELSDLSWKRIEARTLDRLSEEAMVGGAEDETQKRTSILWPLLGGTALAAAAALFVLISGTSSDTGEVAGGETAGGKTAGEVVALESLAQPPSRENSLITTHQEASLLDIGPASVEIAANSSVYIAQHGEAVTLILDSGSLSIQSKGGALIVRAGELEIHAEDSSFVVNRTELGSEVAVNQGSLVIHQGSQQFTLRAKAQWPIPASEAELAAAETIAPSATKASRKSPRELFEEGQGLEASSPRSAIASYKKAWSSKGPWSANALFAHARLEEARGNRKRAQKLLRRYLRVYPNGANSQDARELLR
ncbi:MAG: tetratricopeptide repeat protein [Kofleriaceae bacterium]|nr:tetratricopeptide repeat protein [Kofleriaceae bacterium]